MVAKLLFILTSLLSGSAWTVTYCTTREISMVDPHQATDQVGRFIFSQIHATVLSSEIVRSFHQSSPTSWNLSLKPDLRFHSKTKIPLTAEDVAFSLNRQLARNTDYESDEEAFLPAKLSGLEKFLQTVVVRSPSEIELNFNQPVTESNLRSILDSTVGIIIPKSFTGKALSSGAGKLALRTSEPNLVVMGSDAASATTIKKLSPELLNLEALEKENCKRLYYPTQDLIDGVKAKKVKGALIRASSTLIYLRFFFEKKLPPTLIEKLRAAVHPDRLKVLRNGERTNRIFAVSSHGPSRVDPVKEAEPLPSTLATCEHFAIPPETRSLLESQLEKSFKEALGLEMNWDRIGCSRIVATRHNPDRLGVLSSLEFRSTEELMRALDCEVTSQKIFNVCTTGSAEVREAEILKNGQFLPLARVANEFIEFF